MPSTLKDKILIAYDTIEVIIDIYDTPLAKRFIDALVDNLTNKRILEKNFCFLGWPSSSRDLIFLCKELNKNIDQINSFDFNPCYERIEPFTSDDFQYSSSFPIGRAPDGDISKTLGKRLKHETCNLLHRHFENLQGSAWKLSPYFKQADLQTKYAIRQLNNICHEIESWVNADRKSTLAPEWVRPSQITTFLNAPRYNLHPEDRQLFMRNRYDRELGGVYLHWSQVGKTLYEVFRDEGAPKMTDAMCSEINHQKYYSGEFDIEWGSSITEAQHPFKKDEMSQYREWIKKSGYDWNDPMLSLGYIKLGQVDLKRSFGDESFHKVYEVMKNNLNITAIHIIGGNTVQKNTFEYRLGDANWEQIQIQHLKEGYESRGVR